MWPSEPLNQQLYDQLERAFGDVVVANQGDYASVVPAIKTHDGESRLHHSIRGGEYYRVNCPFCADDRQRLWVSYVWGEEDEDGNDNRHLVYCFNENCIRSRDRQRELQIILMTLIPDLPPRQPRPRRPFVPEVEASREIKLPDNLVPVNQLPKGHPAAVYLTGRGFDLEELWRRWEVSYCEYDGNARPQILNRIVLPVYRPSVLQTGNFTTGTSQTLMGWQARVVGPAEGDRPKYLSCAGMQKSKLLYGYGGAVQSRGPVIVCEGPTDVWRLGRHAVALFGKSLSLFQRELLAHNFRGRPVVVLLDSDAKEEAEAVRREISVWQPMKDSDRKVVVAELPEGGKDPADFPREVVLGCVAKALGSTPQMVGLV